MHSVRSAAEHCRRGKAETLVCAEYEMTHIGFSIYNLMKKYICILAGAASLFAACEQKTETVNPPAGEKKETNTTIVNPSPATTSKTETNTTINTTSSPAASATP
jgi:hypothetical protein